MPEVKKFLFQKTFFVQIKAFSMKTFFKQKSFILIKTLISLKFFICHLSRRIVRKASAGKGVAIEKRRAVILGKGSIRERRLWTIFELHTTSFCWQGGGVRSFDKSDFKSR